MATVRWPAAEAKIRYNVSGTGTAGVSVGQGLFGADGFVTADLEDGRVACKTADMFWATAAGKHRNQCAFVNNSLGIFDNTDLSAANVDWYVGGDPVTDPQPFFPDVAIDGVPYYKWAGGMIRLDDRLLAYGPLGHHVDSSINFLGFLLVGTWAELIFNIDDDPPNWQHLDIPCGGPRDTRSGWLKAGVKDGDYLYFWEARSMACCRILIDTVKGGDMSALEWYDRPNAEWVADGAHDDGDNPKRRLDRLPGTWDKDLNGVRKRPSGLWECTFRDGPTYGLEASEIKVATAAAPGDIFEGETLLYDVPGLVGGKQMYAPYQHPEMTYSGKAGDDVVLIYSTNGGGDVFQNSDTYWPEVLKVDL